MEENFSLAMQLFRQMDRLRRAWHHMAPYPGVSKADFGTMMTLAFGARAKHQDGPPCFEELRWGEEAPGVPISELAQMLGQSLPAVSQRVSALEDAGYVQRVAEKEDRRVTRVRLTHDGAQLLQKVHGRFRTRIDSALSGMTPEEAQELLRLMEKMTQAMENTGKEDETC